MFYGVPYYLQFNGQEIIVMDIVHYNYNTHRIQVSEKLSCEQGMHVYVVQCVHSVYML